MEQQQNNLELPFNQLPTFDTQIHFLKLEHVGTQRVSYMEVWSKSLRGAKKRAIRAFINGSAPNIDVIVKEITKQEWQLNENEDED